MMKLIANSGLWIKAQMKRLAANEKGEVNVVAIVVLIGVAIAVALLFKEQIGKLVNDLFDGLAVKAKGASSTISPE